MLHGCSSHDRSSSDPQCTTPPRVTAHRKVPDLCLDDELDVSVQVADGEASNAAHLEAFSSARRISAPAGGTSFTAGDSGGGDAQEEDDDLLRLSLNPPARNRTLRLNV